MRASYLEIFKTATIHNLRVTGSFTALEARTVKRTAISSDYTLKGNDYLLAVTDTTEQRVITLPSKYADKGRVIIIKDETGGDLETRPILIQTEGNELIDGEHQRTIHTAWSSLTIYSNGTDWFTV